MRILFIGDYSNYHRCVATALRQMDHEVTVASNGSRWMQTERDIDLSRRFPGKLGGLALWIRIKQLCSKFKGYDVVQINNPVFLDLRPNRVRAIFDLLKKHNKAIFLTAMGTDTAYAQMCADKNSPLRYNEWFINGKPSPLYKQKAETFNTWLEPELHDHCQHIYNNIDGVVTALMEYHWAFERIMPVEKIGYAGIPIDADSIKLSVANNIPDKLKFFLGMHSSRKVEKGTDRILLAIRQIVQKYPDKCELQVIENVPYAEYLTLMQGSHVILDQLYSYTPATNALLGMAHGLTAVTGAEPQYYDFINESENRPIINAEPDDEKLYATLEQIVLHPECIIQNTQKNREFVIKHNDYRVVAKRFLDFWDKRLNTI